MATRRQRLVGVLLLAAALPLGIAASTHPPATSEGLTAAERAAHFADFLWIETLIVTLVAPLAGVAALSSYRAAPGVASSRGTRLRRLALTVTLFAASSAIVSVAWMDPAIPPSLLAASHWTLWASALGLSMLGASATMRFSNALDAGALTTLLSAAAGFGLLGLGPLAERVPSTLITAGLSSSPPVVIASAAQIDVLRGEWLYRLSPIAHHAFTYPDWRIVSVAYLVIAVAGLAIASRDNRPTLI